MHLYLVLFVSGVLTILLPCILPLVPIVVGVSITGRHPLRPLLTTLGMVLSFVASTFILQVFLSQFVSLADVIRIATFYILLLFGLGFVTHIKPLQIAGAVMGAVFFWKLGIMAVIIAAVLGVAVMELGSRIATRIQQLGTDIQQGIRSGLPQGSLLSAFIIGLTLGLVWVPCAGPALGFALALVRDEPGLKAFFALTAYGIGAAVPVLIIAYGGQYAVSSARSLSQYSGRIKQVAGVLLILSAIGFQYNILMSLQTWLVNNTSFGTLGNRIEEKFFTDPTSSVASSSVSSVNSVTVPHPNPLPQGKGTSSVAMQLPDLPKIVRAPEFTGLGPWHNSQPLKLSDLKGKVVLVDFWTYSCINCIRTLPYIQGYWDKFKGTLFVLLGVHTPEFVFEKDEGNVSDAIKRHGLTYPIAQDNDYGTWNAFSNRYWPAKYLIDKDGYIRYTHFGEGGYKETDLAIQSLLAEAGVKVGNEQSGLSSAQQDANGGPISPETYVGERNWPSFSNSLGDPDTDMHQYNVTTDLPLNNFALTGTWQLSEDGEYQTMQSDTGEIRYHALAGEVNLVLGMEEGLPAPKAQVFIDGKPGKTFMIDRHDLFNLYKGSYGEHDVVLKFTGKGVQAYAYTFGS